MNNSIMTVILSSQEFDYLRRLEEVEKIIPFSSFIKEGDIYIVMSSTDSCEQLGSYLTLRLAQVGFDVEYRLTPDGERIEKLIDKFATQY